MKLRYRSGSWMLAALLVQAPLFAQAVTKFDVNDLNFLLPLGPEGLPYPEIKVTEGNGLDPETGEAEGQLWPAHLFEDITSKAKGSAGGVARGPVRKRRHSDRLERDDGSPRAGRGVPGRRSAPVPGAFGRTQRSTPWSPSSTTKQGRAGPPSPKSLLRRCANRSRKEEVLE